MMYHLSHMCISNIDERRLADHTNEQPKFRERETKYTPCAATTTIIFLLLFIILDEVQL